MSQCDPLTSCICLFWQIRSRRIKTKVRLPPFSCVSSSVILFPAYLFVVSGVFFHIFSQSCITTETLVNEQPAFQEKVAKLLFPGILLAALIADFIPLTWYFTGCTRAPSDPMFYSPDCDIQTLSYTTVLRPLLLIMRNTELSIAFVSFGRTLVSAGDVSCCLAQPCHFPHERCFIYMQHQYVCDCRVVGKPVVSLVSYLL